MAWRARLRDLGDRLAGYDSGRGRADRLRELPRFAVWRPRIRSNALRVLCLGNETQFIWSGGKACGVHCRGSLVVRRLIIRRTRPAARQETGLHPRCVLHRPRLHPRPERRRRRRDAAHRTLPALDLACSGRSSSSSELRLPSACSPGGRSPSSVRERRRAAADAATDEAEQVS